MGEPYAADVIASMCASEVRRVDRSRAWTPVTPTPVTPSPTTPATPAAPDALSACATPASPREGLVDWMMGTQRRLKMGTAVLSAAVDLVDRYHAAAGAAARGSPRLVASSALLVASKLHDIWPPTLKQLCYAADFSRAQLRAMEVELLNRLSFEVVVPTVDSFLGYFLFVGGHSDDPRTCALARMVADASLLEEQLVHALPSHVAASAILLALLLAGSDAWTLARSSGYTRADLAPCAAVLHRRLLDALAADTSLRTKYAKVYREHAVSAATLDAATLEALAAIWRDGPVEATQARPTEAQPTEARPTEARPTEAQPTEAQPTEAQPTEAQPTEAQATEAQPTQTDPAVPASVEPAPPAPPIEPAPRAGCRTRSQTRSQTRLGRLDKASTAPPPAPPPAPTDPVEPAPTVADTKVSLPLENHGRHAKRRRARPLPAVGERSDEPRGAVDAAADAAADGAHAADADADPAAAAAAPAWAARAGRRRTGRPAGRGRVGVADRAVGRASVAAGAAACRGAADGCAADGCAADGCAADVCAADGAGMAADGATNGAGVAADGAADGSADGADGDADGVADGVAAGHV
jgi:hypothetical protein